MKFLSPRRGLMLRQVYLFQELIPRLITLCCSEPVQQIYILECMILCTGLRCEKFYCSHRKWRKEQGCSSSDSDLKGEPSACFDACPWTIGESWNILKSGTGEKTLTDGWGQSIHRDWGGCRTRSWPCPLLGRTPLLLLVWSLKKISDQQQQQQHGFNSCTLTRIGCAVHNHFVDGPSADVIVRYNAQWK